MKISRKIIAFVLTLAICMAAAVPAFAMYPTASAGATATIGYCGYIDADSNLWLWGPNVTGGVGVEPCNFVEKPVKVMSDVVQFAHNDSGTIVLKKDGSVWTFGSDHCLARYDSGTNSGPTPIKRLDGCSAVSLGTLGSYGALKTNGDLYTWGYAWMGACGFGPENTSIPNEYWSMWRAGTRGGDLLVPCKLLSGVIRFSMGRYIGFASMANNDLWYWGAETWHDSMKVGGNFLSPLKLMSGVYNYEAQGSPFVVTTDSKLVGWGISKMRPNYTFDTANYKFKNRITLGSNVKTVVGTTYEEDLGYEAAWVIKNDGALYSRNGNTWVCGDVNAAFIGDISGYTCKLVLKNDGTLILLKGSGRWAYDLSTEDQVLARNVALSGKPFSSLNSENRNVGNFKDVFGRDYFADPVKWAVEKGVTEGTSATTFSPASTCTRAQIITFLWRAAGSPQPKGDAVFSDVAPGTYYEKACLWAMEKGIARGKTFAPSDPCTREMAVEFMWKFAGSPDARKASFSDVSAPAVDWAVEMGITDGTSATTFSPDKTCTRGQIVTFLYRFMGK